ncbi:hypothetical protein AXF42_Ash018465 [Apostasia shenzhenica]|uniref:CCHC-type domain-containing protein n=1 Tax=Apostasia shenzhenica TaxID=1088818 RepID=A0A2I0BEE4_9ASPA|nr:hypothetical protein AXF42_Ash018465 [Apostasia shenzhenica]
MFTRFTDITNSLISLEKIFTNEELVRKIFRCLLKEYDVKSTAIVEAHDLSKYELDTLLGSLITYEMELQKKKKNEELKRLQKKTLALKTSSLQSDDESANSESDEEGRLDDEIAMISKQFNRLMRKKGKFTRYKKSGLNKEIKKNDIKCYECKEFGHIKPNCPLLKKKKKKKAMVATWSDSDQSSNENEEQIETANLCLMAHDQDNEFDHEEKVDNRLSYEELDSALNELFFEYKKLKNKYFICKKSIIKLEKEKKDLNENLKISETHQSKTLGEVKSLTFENDELKKKISLFENSSKLFSSHMHCISQAKLNDNYFSHSRITCHYCGKNGHSIKDYRIKRTIENRSSSYVWRPKKIINKNEQKSVSCVLGPKVIWAPKLT